MTDSDTVFAEAFVEELEKIAGAPVSESEAALVLDIYIKTAAYRDNTDFKTGFEQEKQAQARSGYGAGQYRGLQLPGRKGDTSEHMKQRPYAARVSESGIPILRNLGDWSKGLSTGAASVFAGGPFTRVGRRMIGEGWGRMGDAFRGQDNRNLRVAQREHRRASVDANMQEKRRQQILKMMPAHVAEDFARVDAHKAREQRMAEWERRSRERTVELDRRRPLLQAEQKAERAYLPPQAPNPYHPEYMRQRRLSLASRGSRGPAPVQLPLPT